MTANNSSSFFVAFHPSYIHQVPSNHRFPMEKYDLIYRQLMHEGFLESHEFLTPNPMSWDLISHTHTTTYVEQLKTLSCTPTQQRVSGFIHNEELIQREQIIMEGTRLCAEKVLAGGIALNIAGGTHHAFSNRGEGFCLLNDQAIAANWLLMNQLTERVLIIDLDVHQGNGTAELFQNNPFVYTFSMHGATNYPLKKEYSSKDISLADGTTDEIYLELLKSELDSIFNEFQPTFLFYQCGVDVLETDQLGKLKLSMEGCKERDRIVFEYAKRFNLPVVCSMGGGYSKDIRKILDAHMNTFRLAYSYFA